MRQEVDKTFYILPLDQPIVCLDASTAFQGLTNQEKLYAYYLSKASWIGGLITLLQTSTEAGQIFVFLHKLYSAESPKEFKENAIKMGCSEDKVTALLVYSAGVFCNAGNYKVCCNNCIMLAFASFKYLCLRMNRFKSKKFIKLVFRCLNIEIQQFIALV